MIYVKKSNKYYKNAIIYVAMLMSYIFYIISVKMTVSNMHTYIYYT